MRVGVFDSGVGGLSVANAIKQSLPEHEIIFKNDRTHVPYGKREPAEILGFVIPILRSLVDAGCAAIVIACNTVSTTLIKELRETFDLPLIAMEPMVKPAVALTASGIITVCATPATLASERYHWLKQTFALNVEVLEPDCSDWSYMIEHNQVEQQTIAARINETLDAGADVIVLGCTHYHWIEKEIVEIAGRRAQVIQPEAALIGRLRQVIAVLEQQS